MVKRKRSREGDLEQKLADSRKEIFRALKGAKGLERQRYSKRMRDDKSTPDKIKRLEREILVLKSLDLQQTADAHLNSSLLKVKQIAESPALPEDIKQGVPKPELSEEEKAALHNVTSGLFNRPHVKEAVEKAVRAVCMILNVPIPDKKKKGKKGAESGREQQQEEVESRDAKKAKLENVKGVSANDHDNDDEGKEEGNPFDEMDDEIPPDSGASDGEVDDADEDDQEINEEDEEKALAAFEAMLGDSEDEESGDEDLKAKYQALLGAAAEADTAEDDSNDDEDGQEDEDLDDGYTEDQDEEDDATDSDRRRRILAADVSLSPSPPPPPAAAARKAKAVARAKKPTGKAGQTTFLPSLMGGYISGSESEASDIDVAPPKKRLGQKQRQAIWQKKYGSQANHVKKQMDQQREGSRDNGWDTRRGAVGGAEDRTGGGKPWKRGVSNPLARQGREGGGGEEKDSRTGIETKRPPPKKDNVGPLHPSWEARKKAKEAQTMAAFQGTKITF